MSAAKRRIKRKIKQLVRMDDTRSWMRQPSAVERSKGLPTESSIYWETCMMPLAQKIKRMGQVERALEALSARRFFRMKTGGRA